MFGTTSRGERELRTITDRAAQGRNDSLKATNSWDYYLYGPHRTVIENFLSGHHVSPEALADVMLMNSLREAALVGNRRFLGRRSTIAALHEPSKEEREELLYSIDSAFVSHPGKRRDNLEAAAAFSYYRTEYRNRPEELLQTDSHLYTQIFERRGISTERFVRRSEQGIESTVTMLEIRRERRKYTGALYHTSEEGRTVVVDLIVDKRGRIKGVKPDTRREVEVVPGLQLSSTEDYARRRTFRDQRKLLPVL